MEFLDEQGVQPCRHKAREKGMIISIFTSCKSNEIPTEYFGVVGGVKNNKRTGKHALGNINLSETQHLCVGGSFMIRCKHASIDEPCTLQPGYTWRKLNASERIILARGKDHDKPAWHYVLLVDDEEVWEKFRAKLASGSVVLPDYGQVLKSGWGRDPPNEIAHEIHKEYLLSENC